jgi:hypothetical protein
VIPPELLIAWGAMIVAAIWIVHQQDKITDMEDTFTEAEEALEAADEAVNTYHRILTDVALGQATLEITHDGNIVAARVADREIQKH